MYDSIDNQLINHLVQSMNGKLKELFSFCFWQKKKKSKTN